LESGWVSSSARFVERFERCVADYLRVGWTVATINGTAALHIALLVVGVQPDDEVLVPTLTFVASANAVRYVGAHPVFIDVEPQHWQMDPERVAEFLTRQCAWNQGTLYNRRTRRRVRAILPVHLLGHPCDMDPILELAMRYQLRVIEDAAESLGARYRGRHVGGFGDMACLSFNGNKTITTGGGGMLVTGNHAWAARARYLTTQAKDDPLEHVHREIGYNYRLSGLQAALGCAQMEQCEQHLARKSQIAQRYREAFAQMPGVESFSIASWATSANWLFSLRFTHAARSVATDAVAFLKEQGIEARRLWRPLHLLPMYQASEVFGGDVAQALSTQVLCLPSSVDLNVQEQDVVIDAVRMFIGSIGRHA